MCIYYMNEDCAGVDVNCVGVDLDGVCAGVDDDCTGVDNSPGLSDTTFFPRCCCLSARNHCCVLGEVNLRLATHLVYGAPAIIFFIKPSKRERCR